VVVPKNAEKKIEEPRASHVQDGTGANECFAGGRIRESGRGKRYKSENPARVPPQENHSLPKEGLWGD